MGSCGASCGKAFLVVVNTLFFLLGATLLGIGAAVRFKEDLVVENAEELFEAIDLGEASDINMKDFLNSVALVFIISGAVAALIGIAGCVGACCEVKLLLVVYSIFVILILAAQVAGVALMFIMRNEVDKVLKTELKDSIHKYYSASNSSTGVSLAWNGLFLKFDCCGVDGYEDFENASKWDEMYNNTKLKTPITCCKEASGSPTNYKEPSDLTCATNPNDNNSNWKKGCYKTIEDFITLYGYLFIGIGIGVVIFELLCVIFAIVVCRNAGDKKGHAV